MFKEEREESQFEWSMLGDIEKGRPNLGPMVHVAVYRLMQFTLHDLLIREFGDKKTDRIIFEAGKKAGEEYCKNILTDAMEQLLTQVRNGLRLLEEKLPPVEEPKSQQ